MLTSCIPSVDVIENNTFDSSSPLLKQTIIISLIPPSSTPVPTITYTPKPSIIPSLTSTPDLRIINTSPLKLLCQKEDLPALGVYYFPSEEWVNSYSNRDKISKMGESGKDYLERTGRVIGWEANYYSRHTYGILPYYLYCRVTLFKTIDGAKVAYNWPSTNSNEDWNENKIGVTSFLGDENSAWEYYLYDNNENIKTWYLFTYRYKNLIISVGHYSPVDDSFYPEIISQIAEKMFQRIYTQELINPEKFTYPK
jgi:hypothetical protein